MIIHRPYKSLGKADHGWLKANHHFSFADYYNPERMGFGALRVINDDTIKAGGGFPTHPHKNMEIITYVRTGAISHQDSNGDKGKTNAGSVQVMSAGRGIHHSEYNLESTDTTLYQIWIKPNKRNIEPKWNSHNFPQSTGLELLVSGDGSAPLQIQQDAYIYGGKLETGKSITHTIKHQAYVLISKGVVKLDDVILSKGDGAEVIDQSTLTLIPTEDAEVIIIDVPAEATQH